MNNPRVEITRFLHDELFGIRAHLYVEEHTHIRLLDVNAERIAFRADFGAQPEARTLGRRLADALLVRYGDAISPTRLGIAVGEPAAVCPGFRPAWPSITFTAYAERIPTAGRLEADEDLAREFDGPAEEARETIRALWAAGEADGWSDPTGPDGMWFGDRAFGEDRGFEWLIEGIERKRAALGTAGERKEGRPWSRWVRS